MVNDTAFAMDDTLYWFCGYILVTVNIKSDCTPNFWPKT